MAVLRDGKDAGDISVGRHDDLIPYPHHTHLDVGSQNQRQRIEAVAASNAMLRADIRGISLLKRSRGLSLEIPPAVEHTTNGRTNLRIVQVVYFLQVEIFDHRSYS